MSSKLGIFCTGIIEACWLMALVTAPLFVDYHSSTVFDPDKSGVIRSIAIAMLIAFLIRNIERTKSPEQNQKLRIILWQFERSELLPGMVGCKSLHSNSRTTNYVFIIALIFFASYLFSTIFAASPHTAWWGSYARNQGMYTLLSYAIIFSITALSLNSAAQIDRMMQVIVLTSIPICLYGLTQRFKIDPLVWDTDFSVRIGSTLGNPIFLGSYLIMVIPVSLALLLGKNNAISFPRTLVPMASGPPEGLTTRTAGLAVILLLQLVCLWMTGSRGPFLGMMTGGFFFIVLWAITSGKKWLGYLTYLGAAAVIGFLILLNIPNSPLKSIKPKFGRFGQIFESREPAARARLLIWEGVTNMVKSDHTRAIIGYGPENLYIPYHKYTPPELVRIENKIAFPDRAHNELFDTIITNGLTGALIYIALFGTIIFYAFKYLGALRHKRAEVTFILLLITGVIAGIVLPYLLQGTFIYCSIAVPIGLVMGAVIYLFYSLLTHPPCGAVIRHPCGGTGYSLLPIAIFSVLIGHFVETQFGIALTASRTYFWIMLAVLVSLGLRAESKEQTTIPHPTSILPAILGLIILTTFAFDLFYMQYAPDTARFIWRAAGLLTVTWLVTGIYICLFAGHSRENGNPDAVPAEAGNYKNPGFRVKHGMTSGVGMTLSNLILYYSLTLLVTLVFIFILFMFLPPLITPIHTITFFYLWLALMLGIITWMITLGQPHGVAPLRSTLHTTRSTLALALLLGLAGVLFIWHSNINPARASILYKIGSSQEKANQLDSALWHYQEAAKRAADNSYFYASIARIYMEKSQREKDSKKRAELLQQCQNNLLKSIEYEPYSPTRNANIARFYRVWASALGGPGEHAARYEQSHKYYKIACNLSPQNPSLMNEWGETYYEERNLPMAIEKYQQSLIIDPNFSETLAHLGDIYFDKQDITKALEYYHQAALIHKQGLERMKDPNQELLYQRTNQMLIKYKPNDYLGYYNLMNFYIDKGETAKAREMAQKVKQLAPNITIPQIP